VRRLSPFKDSVPRGSVQQGLALHPGGLASGQIGPTLVVAFIIDIMRSLVYVESYLRFANYVTCDTDSHCRPLAMHEDG
jgi:hypothetical protein